MITSHLMCANFFMINLTTFQQLQRKLGKTCYMIKPFRHCEIQDTKKLKRKPSFFIEAAVYRRFSK